MLSKKFYRVASFGLEICQRFLPNSYFHYLFKKHCWRILMPKQDTISHFYYHISTLFFLFSLLHFMIWCGNPWTYRNRFKLCVNIPNYIFNIFSKVPGGLTLGAPVFFIQLPLMNQYFF